MSRIAKFPAVANPSFIATPEDSTFTLAFRDNTDGLYYAKRSTGVVEPIGGGGGSAKTSETGVAAAGINQGAATNVTKDFVKVDVAGPGNDGVKVLPAILNANQRVLNNTPVNINVYPQVGHAFTGLAPNIPVIVAPGMSIETFCFAVGVYVLL